MFHIISLAFDVTPCYSNQSAVWHLCLLIGSLIFISSQRDEMRDTLASAHSYTREGMRTPPRKISWLLKYNYLTAGCHLGRCLDRLFLSVLSRSFCCCFCTSSVFPAAVCLFPRSLFFLPFTDTNKLIFYIFFFIGIIFTITGRLNCV